MSRKILGKQLSKLATTICALGLVGSMVGCAMSVGNTDTPADTPAGEQKEFNMVFIVKSGSVNFFTDMMDQAQAAAAMLPNVNIKCQTPETGFDANQQLELIKQAINEGVDTVLCTAADATTISEGVKNVTKQVFCMLHPTLRLTREKCSPGLALKTWTLATRSPLLKI